MAKLVWNEISRNDLISLQEEKTWGVLVRVCNISSGDIYPSKIIKATSDWNGYLIVHQDRDTSWIYDTEDNYRYFIEEIEE